MCPTVNLKALVCQTVSTKNYVHTFTHEDMLSLNMRDAGHFPVLL